MAGETFVTATIESRPNIKAYARAENKTVDGVESAAQKERDAKLEKEFATRDRDLVAAQKDLKELEDRLQKDGAIMSETERGRIERDIVNKRRDLKRDTQEFQEDVNFRRNEEMAKIQQEIAEAIVKFGKSNNFDVIFGNGVLYMDEKHDVTDALIEKLKGGK